MRLLQQLSRPALAGGLVCGGRSGLLARGTLSRPGVGWTAPSAWAVAGGHVRLFDTAAGRRDGTSASAGLKSVAEVLEFWFGDMERYASSPEYKTLKDKQWWSGLDEQFNRVQIASAALTSAAASGELSGEEWESPKGALARILVMDQFPRTVYRGTAEAFGSDEQAVKLAMACVSAGWDSSLGTVQERMFCYMPLMHSESLEAQDMSVEVLTKLLEDASLQDDPESKKAVQFSRAHAMEHRDVVKRFGRFPHRNWLLGRESTAEEEAWLASEDLPPWAKSQMPAAAAAT